MEYMITMMMMNSIMFMIMKHPLSAGITIIIQTLLVALMMGMMAITFWFSYILVIIMLSGMLVLIIYMASIASNEKFKSNIKTMFMLNITILTFTLLNSTSKPTTMESMMMPSSTEVMSLSLLFNYSLFTLTILMVMYMLFSMITISTIVNIDEGPLRKTN